jgi:CMP-N-acetylneuraminic acid synthetase
MKIHFITCARKGSKRLLDKNIKEIAGLKLIEYTFRFMQNCKERDLCDYLWLITDDERIKKISLKYDIDSSYIRPEKDSLSSSTMNETVQNWLKFMNFDLEDKIMLLQPTSPVRYLEDCKNILKMDIPMSHMIVGCVEMPGNISDYYINEKKINTTSKDLLNFIDGSYYLTDVNRLLNGEGFDMTSSDKLFKTKLKVPLDIDFEKDLYLAELLLKEDNCKNGIF